MKQKLIIAISIAASSMNLWAKDGGFDLPSSAPIKVFEVKQGQIGIGYVNFNVKLEVEDAYYKDKIGDIDHKTNGLMVTFPAATDTIIGQMFEYSYTAGAIDSTIKTPVFTDNGKTYNNAYDKTGFYVGWRPAFSATLKESESFKLQSATSLHFVAYHLSGDFTVSHNGGGPNNYSYDESSYGIGVKPTTVISGTYFPTKNIGISGYGGLTTFAALDLNDYVNKNNSFDEDTEFGGYASAVSPIYGADIIFRNIFAQGDTFSLSTVITRKNDDSNIETIIRYVFTF